MMPQDRRCAAPSKSHDKLLNYLRSGRKPVFSLSTTANAPGSWSDWLFNKFRTQDAFNKRSATRQRQLDFPIPVASATIRNAPILEGIQMYANLDNLLPPEPSRCAGDAASTSPDVRSGRELQPFAANWANVTSGRDVAMLRLYPPENGVWRRDGIPPYFPG